MRILILLVLLGFCSPVLASEITKESVLGYVNSERLTPLLVNPRLELAAQLRADYMAPSGVFSHDAFGMKNVYKLYLDMVGYRYRYSGENLAKQFLTVEDMHAALMVSPTHRANIVDLNYREIGVGIATSSSGIVYVVQEFGSR
jgi:uncharacterized protein YkwD